MDHIADINLIYRDIAREYLPRERIPTDCIIKTVSPMFEVPYSHKTDIEKSDVLGRLGLKNGHYFVISEQSTEKKISV